MTENKQIWTLFKENRSNLDLYTDDAAIVHVPTLVGAKGKTEIRKFFLHSHFSPKANIVKEDLIDTLVSKTKLIEEAVWTIHFYSGACNWLVPNIEERYLVNATIKFPVTTSVSFVNEKIHSVRYNWDQACVLGQLKVFPEKNNWPVTGEQQADALQSLKEVTLKGLDYNIEKPAVQPLTNSRSSGGPPIRNIFTYEPPAQRPLVAPHPNKLGSSIILGQDEIVKNGHNQSSHTRQSAIHYPGNST